MFDSDYMLPFFSAKIPPRGYALVGMTDFFDSLIRGCCVQQPLSVIQFPKRIPQCRRLFPPSG